MALIDVDGTGGVLGVRDSGSTPPADGTEFTAVLDDTEHAALIADVRADPRAYIVPAGIPCRIVPPEASP